MRAAPSGPAHGISLTIRAALAPTMLKISGSFSPSALKEHGLDLHFVIPALRKERADGAVGEAAGENFLFGGAAFALEVAAGEFAGCGRFFAVIHGQREEVLAFLGLGRGHGGHDDDGFAHLDGHGAVGLLGQFAGFNGDLLVADGGGDFL
jgi:hypothetical protein